MFNFISGLFAKTVGAHNKDANDWFGPNSWWGKLTGSAGEVVSKEVSKDVGAKAQESLIAKVLIGFIVYKAFLD